MELSEHLLTLSGRILPKENIILGSEVRYDTSQACDWTKQLRRELFFVILLKQ
jgi:hypothetical protein